MNIPDHAPRVLAMSRGNACLSLGWRVYIFLGGEGERRNEKYTNVSVFTSGLVHARHRRVLAANARMVYFHLVELRQGFGNWFTRPAFEENLGTVELFIGASPEYTINVRLVVKGWGELWGSKSKRVESSVEWNRYEYQRVVYSHTFKCIFSLKCKKRAMRWNTLSASSSAFGP